MDKHAVKVGVLEAGRLSNWCLARETKAASRQWAVWGRFKWRFCFMLEVEGFLRLPISRNKLEDWRGAFLWSDCYPGPCRGVGAALKAASQQRCRSEDPWPGSRDSWLAAWMVCLGLFIICTSKGRDHTKNAKLLTLGPNPTCNCVSFCLNIIIRIFYLACWEEGCAFSTYSPLLRAVQCLPRSCL